MVLTNATRLRDPHGVGARDPRHSRRTGLATRAEVRHEAVAIAAVDRAHKLDGDAVLVATEALEHEGGRVEGHSERRRFLLVRHRRLDRLDAARDRDAVALAEQLVERAPFEVRAGEVGDDRLGHVQRLDRHRLAVGKADALSDHDPLRGRDVEEAAEARARRDDLERERPAARAHAAAAHVLGERRHRQLLRDLRLADERARAAPADEETFADKVVERRPNRQPRNAEIGAQLALRGDRLPDVEPFDQVEHPAFRLALLRHGVAASSASAGARGSGSESRLKPVAASKKCSRAGSTKSSSGRPTRAGVAGSTRAANRLFASGRSVASSGFPRISAVTGGAETGKKTCASEPSSSTTAGTTSSCAAPAVAARSSKASGRMPTITLLCDPCGRRLGSSRSRCSPKTASSPSSDASTRFIAGVPMNAATKTLSGRSYSRCGVSHWSTRPSLITATRWPRVIASVWSCVT